MADDEHLEKLFSAVEGAIAPPPWLPSQMERVAPGLATLRLANLFCFSVHGHTLPP
ncbi:MAG TPA: hypothetical protein V6D20_16635 [Candidatus Obscuribacterales bacterium]